MADNLSPKDRRRTMQAVKGKSTGLERRVAAMLAGMRLKGWKKNCQEICGKPDIIFPKEKLAIFVDGCFWHGCQVCNRPLPLTNQKYWEQKIRRNIERAEIYNELLSQSGWTVIHIWEHELHRSVNHTELRAKIRNALINGASADDKSYG